MQSSKPRSVVSAPVRRVALLAGVSVLTVAVASGSGHAAVNPFARVTNVAQQIAAASNQGQASISAAQKAALAALETARQIQSNISLAEAQAQAQAQAQAKAKAQPAFLSNTSNMFAGSAPDGIGAGGLQPLPGGQWSGAQTPTQTLDGSGNYTVNIDQKSTGYATAILTWDSFNVGLHTTLNFLQNASSDVVLNRVLGSSTAPSQILGSINAIGKVYILNQNGIIFGGSSQVNVGSLIAAAARFTDDQFNANGVFSASSPTLTELTGQVTVEQGAILSTPAPSSDSLVRGGYIALMGSEVENDGVILTPSGQTLLVAGDQVSLRKGYDPNANPGSTTLGIEAAPVFLPSGAASGIVKNTGMIEADTGDISLVGRAVTQNGMLLSTSTTQQRGTIHLLTSASDAQSSVTFGQGSLTEVMPDLTATATATDAQRLALMQKSGFNTAATGAFDDLSALADRPDLGRIEVVTGGLVRFYSKSLTLANGGQIAVQAGLRTLSTDPVTNATTATQTGKIEVETGATLDVSGVQNVQKSVLDNFLKINVQPYDLRDSPVNRDNRGANSLINTTVSVDIRSLIYVPAGVGGDPSPRAYTPGGLLEVSGYLANQTHGIGDWASIGGAVTLSAGAVVTEAHSTINLAGGYITYAGGMTPQSVLLGADGKTYTPNNAPLNIEMSSGGLSYDATHPRWGKTYDSTFSSPFSAGLSSNYEPGYVVQRDGGALIVSAQSAVLNGDVAAEGGAQGAHQTLAHPTPTDASTKALAPLDPYAVGQLAYNASQAASSTNAALGVPLDQGPTTSPDSYSLSQYVASRAGGLFIEPAQEVLGADSNGNVTYGPGLGPALSNAALNLTPGGAATPPAAQNLPTALTGVITLDPNVLSDGGLGALSVKILQGANLTGALSLSPGGALQILAGGVTLDGSLTAPSGSISLSGLAYDGQTYNYGPITLKTGARIDTRGLVTNGLIDATVTGGPAFINGGPVTLKGAGLSLAKGSSIDASAAASISPAGAFQGGNGGDITLVNDNEAIGPSIIIRPVTALQPFVLNGDLRSQGFGKGGALTITGAGPLLIADHGSVEDDFADKLNTLGTLTSGQSAPVSLLLAQAIVVKAGDVIPFTWTDGSPPTLPADKDAVFNMAVVLKGTTVDPNTTTGPYGVTQQDWTVGGSSPVILQPPGVAPTTFQPGQTIPKGTQFAEVFIYTGTVVPRGVFDPTVQVGAKDNVTLPVNTGTTYLAGSIAPKDLIIPVGTVIPNGPVFADVEVRPITRLAPSFFSSGFSKYAISALGGVSVAPNTQIDVVQPVLQASQDLSTSKEAPIAANALSPTLPPLFTLNSKTGQMVQRAGADLSLTALSLSNAATSPPLDLYLSDNAEIHIGLGARIEVDPGHAISLQGPGQQTIDGALIAPSGTISITTPAKNGAYFLGDNAPYRSIWLGVSSLLDASGRAYTMTDPSGRQVVAFSDLSGGNVTVGSAEVAKYQITPLTGSLSQAVDQPFVVTAPGSKIDVSGRANPNLQSPAGDAGTVTFASNVGLVLNGGVDANAGGPGAAGGQLRVIQEGLGLVASYDHFTSDPSISSGVADLRYVIPSEIVFNAPTGSTLSPTDPAAPLDPEGFRAKTWLGQTELDVGAFALDGFTRLDFLARDAFVFNGSVDLSAGQSLVLERGVIGEPVANAHVTLSAPYLRLVGVNSLHGPDQPPFPYATPAYGGLKQTGQLDAAGYQIPLWPTFSPGSLLTLKGGLIDLVGEVTFGGTQNITASSDILALAHFNPADIQATNTLAGFQNVVMQSDTDIRIVAGGPTASEQNSDSQFSFAATPDTGEPILTSGDLTLRAQRIYATGSYSSTAYEHQGVNGPAPTAIQVQGVLTIQRIDTSTPPAPLTYGDTLSLTAGAIYDNGVIWQPFGTVTFNGPTVFQPNSYTSVSGLGMGNGLGLTAPFGGTSDGANYTTPEGAAYSLGNTPSSTGNGVFSVTPKISINSSNVTAQKGAVLDLRGGGSLFGEGFIRGKGGSVDVLDAPYAVDPATGAIVTKSASAPTVYALVPGVQATASPITPAGQASGADPLSYSTVKIPEGVPGLPAGFYTLLPADYALAPGAYRVQIGAPTPTGQARGVDPLTDGSYKVGAVLGGLGGLGPSEAVSLILSSGSVVRRHATYNEETPDAFNAAWATAQHVSPFLPTGGRNSAYPYLTIDGGQLSLASTPIEEVLRLDFSGKALFDSATGGAPGGVNIDLSNSDQFDNRLPEDACLYATQVGADCHGLNIDVASLNAIAAPTLSITAGNITFEQSAVLKAGQVELNVTAQPTDSGGTSLYPDQHLTFHSGAGIDTTGSSISAAYQGVFITVGGGNSYYNTYANGFVSLESGASLLTQGKLSFTVNGLGSLLVDPAGRLVAGDLVLSSNYINIGSANAANAPSGLQLRADFIDRLAGRAGGSISTSHITLIATSALNFLGDANLDFGVSSGKTLTLETGAILGTGAGDAIISADTVEWFGGPSGGTGQTRYQQSPSFAGGPGTGTGQLDINARVLRLGGVAPTLLTNDNQLAPTNAASATPAAQETLGFSNVALNATAVIRFVGPGSLDVYQSQDQFGQPGVGGNLTFNAPVLVTTAAEAMTVAAGGRIEVSSFSGAASSAAPGDTTPGLSGSLTFSGQSIDIEGAVRTPSGRLTLNAQSGVTLGAASLIDLSGTLTPVLDQTAPTPGGILTVSTVAGDIRQQSGATINVSAPGAAAGSMSFYDMVAADQSGGGAIDLEGVLLGGAPKGFQSGKFMLSAKTLGNFADLNAQLNAGGVFASRAFEIGTGDLTVSGGVKAQSISIALDAGHLTIDSLIDASGGAAGTIKLSGMTGLTLTGAAVLDAHGDTLAVDSRGIPIAASNTPLVMLTGQNGGVSIMSGARLDVRSADQVARGDIEINAPRMDGQGGIGTGAAETYGDVALDVQSGLTVLGAASLSVNGFYTYKLDTLSPDYNITSNVNADDHTNYNIDQALLDKIDGHSQAFINNTTSASHLQASLANLKLAAPGVVHLRPGVVLTTADPTADLSVTGDIDLSKYRYGPGANATPGAGEPGVLQVRAGGNLYVYGSVTDGFQTPPAPSQVSQGAFITSDTLWLIDFYLPAPLDLASGSKLPSGVTYNYDVRVLGTYTDNNSNVHNLLLPSGKTTPVSLSLSLPTTVSADFIATANIRDATGNIVFAKGQKVPAGAVLAANDTVDPGFGGCPIDLSVGPVTWPKGAPLVLNYYIPPAYSGGYGSYTNYVLVDQLSLKPGALIPASYGNLVYLNIDPSSNANVIDNGTLAAYVTSTQEVFALLGHRGPDDTLITQQKFVNLLGKPLPSGSLSWSMQFVGGANLAAADPGGTLNGQGSLILSDPHTLFGPTGLPPTGSDGSSLPTNYLELGLSALRTGTGRLDLNSGQDILIATPFGVYTAGTPDAGSPPVSMPRTTDYASYVMQGGGDVNVAARRDLAQLLLTEQAFANFAFSGGFPFNPSTVGIPNETNFVSDSPGHWLWLSTSPTDGKGAWTINFGWLEDQVPYGQGLFTPYALNAFTGIGALGGGNVDLTVGGDAGAGAGGLDRGSISNKPGALSGLNVAIGASGEYVGGAWRIGGGGNLTVSVGGQINPDWSITAGSQPANVPNYLTNSDQAGGPTGGLFLNLRGPSDIRTAGFNFAAIAPGDGAFSVTADRNLFISAVVNPGFVQSADFTTAPPGASAASNWVANVFNLWTDATKLTLTAGGDVTPSVNKDGAFNTDAYNGQNSANLAFSYLPSIVNIFAPSGSVFLPRNTTELLPSARGGLTLLVGANLVGPADITHFDPVGAVWGNFGQSYSALAVSGADASAIPSPDHPLDLAAAYSGAVKELYPYANSLMFAYGPDTVLPSLHTGDTTPNRIYAGGDINDVAYGEILQICLNSGLCGPRDLIGSKATYVEAGRDITDTGAFTLAPSNALPVNSGLKNLLTFVLGDVNGYYYGPSTATAGLFVNPSSGDVSVFKAGRDLIDNRIDVIGRGVLSIEAGRDLIQNGATSLDAGFPMIESLGPITRKVGDLSSGPGISITVGTGDAGPDYAAFAALYLDPTHQANLSAPLASAQNAGKVAHTYQAELYDWMKSVYGYSGAEADSLAAFYNLSAEQQAVFLRQVFYQELVASGREYTDPANLRFGSYLRGKDATSVLFPGRAADGQPITYQGALTLLQVTHYTGVVTDFGGSISLLAPGGGVALGEYGAQTPGAAGLITGGAGDIDIFARDSIILGASRVFTTYGGNIAMWSETGDINAGIGAKTTSLAPPVDISYTDFADVIISPSIPAEGSGIATLAPVPSVPPGDVDLIAPLGVVDAGEAGIRVSGNINIAAVAVANAANIQVTGKARGLPVVATVNTGALTAAAAQTQSAMSGFDAAENARKKKPKKAPKNPFTLFVRLLGYGG